ncbi:MAG: hypothetical protein B6I34_03035 [Anaerolineaceae bacterium 4572_32.1]|nr:MAG: hypothetical protein B6I34_03035 [Anaerolineaceae bacterium 4572_32.1]
MINDKGLNNRWIDLRLWPGRPLTGGGPLWAALCGLIASGSLKADGSIALTVGFALFLAGPMWGTVWQAVAAADWFTPFSAREWPASAPWVTLLPYTAPDSPSGRLAQVLGRIRVWWRECLWPRYGDAVVELLVALPLSLGVALVVGRAAVLLTVAVWALATLAQMVDRGAGAPPAALQAIMEGGLAWLLGHAVLSELTWPSAAIAGSFALAYAAALTLTEGNRRALLWLNSAQAMVVILLIAQGYSISAALVVLLMLLQLALQASLHRDGDAPQYLRRAQPFVMAIMLLTAFSL